jgi:hypothetical protein
MTGFVYAFRYGDGDHVKIGKTNDLNKRRQALQGAHHNPLVLVESIEHDDYQEGEKYIHQLLAPRRVQARGAGSREHFLVPGAELTEAFQETRTYLDFELPRQRELPKYEALEAGEHSLPATEEILVAKHRREEVRATRAGLQAEVDRLDDDVRAVYQRQRTDPERLNRMIQEVDVEEAQLVTTVKLAIGPAAGIDGVATWESVADPRRRFDQEWLKADDPELFDAYRTAFDAARFKKEHPAVHEAHMRVTTHREFRWIDDDDFGSDNETRGAPASRWRRAIARTTRHHTQLPGSNGART